MLNTALLMLMIALLGAYVILRIAQSYRFFTQPIFCVLMAAALTGAFHWGGKLSRNEDLFFLVSIAAMLFWFGRANYSQPVKVAEDVFNFQEVK